MPSTVSWDGGGGSYDWNNALNWNTDALPGAGDDVQIGEFSDSQYHVITVDSGASVTIKSLTSVEDLSMTGGTLSIASSSTIDSNLWFTGGNLSGSGSLSVNGLFYWSGGTLSGSGRLDANVRMDITGAADKLLDGRSLFNYGPATWSGSGNLLIFHDAILTNAAGATFDVQTDADVYVSGTSDGFINEAGGTFVKSAGAVGEATGFQGYWVNRGVLRVQQGALGVNLVTSADQGASTGIFQGWAGTTLMLAGGELTSTSQIASAGNVILSGADWAGGVLSVAGQYDVTGSTRVAGQFGTVRFTGTIAHVGALTVDAGANIADFSPAAGFPITATSLTLTPGATLTGTASFMVSGPFAWTGGTLGGSGTVSANGGMSLSGPARKFLDGRTLVNAGSAVWSGSGDWFLSGNAVVRNAAGATFDIQTDADVYVGGTFDGFINEADGTFVKSAGAVGEATGFQGYWVNRGVLRVEQGTLGVNLVTGLNLVTSADQGASTGIFQGWAGTTLMLAGGELTSTSQIASAGTVILDAAEWSNGQMQMAGQYNVTGSTVLGRVGPGSQTVRFTGQVLSVGALTVGDVTADFHGSPLNLTDLTLAGDLTCGPLAVSHLFTWQNGTLVGTGPVTVGDLDLTQGLFSGRNDWILDGRTLTATGTTRITTQAPKTLAVFTLKNGAEFHNQGTFLAGHPYLQYGPEFVASGTAPVAFVNAGTFVGGQGDLFFDVPFTNQGTVNVTDLWASFGYLQTAGSTVFAGGHLLANVTLQGGVLSGNGVISGILNNSGGQINPGGIGAPGQLYIFGNYTQEPNGVLNIEINPDTGQSDLLIVASRYRFDGTLNITSLGSSLPPINSPFVNPPGYEIIRRTIYNGVGEFPAVTQPDTANGQFYSPAYGFYSVWLMPTVTSDSLQAAISRAPANSTFPFQANSDGAAQTVLQAVNGLGAQTVSPTVVLNLAPNTTYRDEDVAVPAGVTLVINGDGGTTTIVGQSPALRVRSGNVVVRGVILSTNTDSPTILVTGGSLTLSNCTVQESTGYTDSAISVTGGTLDLGTAASPGNNIINVNGSGDLLHNTSGSLVSASGTTFQSNSSALSTGSLSFTTLTSSAGVALLNQPVTFMATVRSDVSGGPTPTGTVEFVDLTTSTSLGTVTLLSGSASLTVSTLSAGNHRIAAKYSGDATNFAGLDSVAQSVRYTFSGFLAPLNGNIALATNRTVPIKFQLTDYSNKFITSLGAVTSLVVLNSYNQNVLTNAGSTALRYDSSANQFLANWQTKGLPVGTYTVKLTLADGAVYSKTVQLSPNGSTAGLLVDGSVTTTATGALLGGDIEVYVDNSNGELTGDELARIQDAVTAVDGVTEAYGVKVEEVPDPTLADVTLTMDSTSAVGGYADGVLGCTTDAGQITLIQGWNFYAGSDASQIGAGQYDFETVVTHELGHALGLGHSSDAASVMYATLASGGVNRALSTADLNVADVGADGACGLHAIPTTDNQQAGRTFTFPDTRQADAGLTAPAADAMNGFAFLAALDNRAAMDDAPGDWRSDTPRSTWAQRGDPILGNESKADVLIGKSAHDAFWAGYSGGGMPDEDSNPLAEAASDDFDFISAI